MPQGGEAEWWVVEWDVDAMAMEAEVAVWQTAAMALGGAIPVGFSRWKSKREWRRVEAKLPWQSIFISIGKWLVDRIVPRGHRIRKHHIERCASMF